MGLLGFPSWTGISLEHTGRSPGGLYGRGCGNLDGIAHCMKNNLSGAEFAGLVGLIGKSMRELIDISRSLHQTFPDIVPQELKPSP